MIDNLLFEQKYKPQVVLGIDEAGRGAFAGPVVAGAVIVDDQIIIDGIDDSKKISKPKREKLYNKIINSYQYAVGIVNVEYIDKYNILQATKQACLKAISALNATDDIILIDGNMAFGKSNIISVIKGDSLVYSIAAASIVAKVTRDNIMSNLSAHYPEYGWGNNAGYGTKQHINAIKNYGITTEHRKTFLKNYVI